MIQTYTVITWDINMVGDILPSVCGRHAQFPHIPFLSFPAAFWLVEWLFLGLKDPCRGSVSWSEEGQRNDIKSVPFLSGTVLADEEGAAISVLCPAPPLLTGYCLMCFYSPEIFPGVGRICRNRNMGKWYPVHTVVGCCSEIASVWLRSVLGGKTQKQNWEKGNRNHCYPQMYQYSRN